MLDQQGTRRIHSRRGDQKLSRPYRTGIRIRSTHDHRSARIPGCRSSSHYRRRIVPLCSFCPPSSSKRLDKAYRQPPTRRICLFAQHTQRQSRGVSLFSGRATGGTRSAAHAARDAFVTRTSPPGVWDVEQCVRAGLSERLAQCVNLRHATNRRSFSFCTEIDSSLGGDRYCRGRSALPRSWRSRPAARRVAHRGRAARQPWNAAATIGTRTSGSVRPFDTTGSGYSR